MHVPHILDWGMTLYNMPWTEFLKHIHDRQYMNSLISRPCAPKLEQKKPEEAYNCIEVEIEAV